MPETTTTTPVDTTPASASDIIAALAAVETWIEMHRERNGKFTEDEHRSITRLASRIRHAADEMTE